MKKTLIYALAILVIMGAAFSALAQENQATKHETQGQTAAAATSQGAVEAPAVTATPAAPAATATPAASAATAAASTEQTAPAASVTPAAPAATATPVTAAAPIAAAQVQNPNTTTIKGTVQEIAEDGSYVTVNGQKILTTQAFMDDYLLLEGDEVEITADKTANGLQAKDCTFVSDETAAEADTGKEGTTPGEPAAADDGEM